MPGAAVKIQDKTSTDPAINLDRESRTLIEGLFTLKSDVFNAHKSFSCWDSDGYSAMAASGQCPVDLRMQRVFNEIRSGKFE